MWIIRISLDLTGDKFSSKEFLKELEDDIYIFTRNEPDEINEKDPKGIFGFGSLTVICPKIYGLQYEMIWYEKWYLDFIDKNKKLLDKNKVTEMSLYIEVFDNGGQLNFEIFSKELLQKIGKYSISIPISYYRLTSEQIIEMLNETQISKDKLKKYISVG